MRPLALFALASLLTVASAQPADSGAFQLILNATERQIHKGQVKSSPVVKHWTLPAEALAGSRQSQALTPELSAALRKVGQQVNARKPQPASFKNVQGSWAAKEQTGWVFDQQGTEAKVLAALQAGQNQAEVVYKAVSPQRSVAVLAQRGVLWYVGQGSTSYRGSPPFREHNVLLGASKLHDQMIAPGQEFNFNKAVGEVTTEQGYVDGYIISGDKLTKEEGGGICQVSATIFRALYQAGLPIVERHSHSHRVHYYDPVGYEATVYAPVKNLRMKNDTPKHLLIQASWDRTAQTLRFNIFGAKPERTVKVNAPVVTNFRPPASTTYVADSGVPYGQRYLLEGAMQGMTSTIVRTITAKGGQKTTDTLKSVYAPWGAVYRVNPKDRRLRD